MTLFQNRFSGSTANEEQWVTSWWCTSSMTESTVNTQAVAWWTAFLAGASTNGYALYTTADVVCNQVETITINPATGRQLTKTVSEVDLPGTASGNALPAECSIVVSLRTLEATRSGRGRIYLPQPAATALTATGEVAATPQTNIVNALVHAWTGFSSYGTPVLWSRKGLVSNNITTLDVAALFRVQRRRQKSLTPNRMSAAMP